MRSFALFGVIACALVADAQSNSAGGDCDPTDVACNIGQLGFNSAAASYLAGLSTDTQLEQAAQIIATAPAFATATDIASNGVGLYSDYLAEASAITDSGLRDHFTSAVGHLLALQTGGSPAASGSAPAASGSGSSGSASAASSGGAPSSMTSHAMAPVARQTGAAMYAAAGVAAGVAGLAIGL